MARGIQRPPERPILTIPQTLSVIERLKKRVTELKAFDPSIMKARFDCPELTALEAAIDETLVAAFGHQTPDYRRYSSAADLDKGSISMVTGFERGPRREDIPEVFQGFVRQGRDQAIALLEQAIRGLEESLPALTTPAPSSAPKPSNKIFVVHGHDEAALHGLARFLEKLGLEAVILREQPDQGRTIIEKFEDCARSVGFAVVLMTPDDLGSGDANAMGSRARQNVIFELGYFAGKLGRGKSCLLRKGAIEMPSDLYGIIYTDMDDSDGWKIKLVREFKAANLDFDANLLWA